MVKALKRPNRKLDRTDPEAVKARNRVTAIIDSVPPEELVESIKRAPSLRGMILGYVAEHMFVKHVLDRYPVILSEHIEHHDDHDRTANKSDRTIAYNGRKYGIQLKSIQTNSIVRDLTSGHLHADVQNDASDRRTVRFADGSSVETTCYKKGEYDILAVPLFPFLGAWEFAYKLNAHCAPCTSLKYTAYQREHLLSTTERMCWPLDANWHTDLTELLTPENGSSVILGDVVAQPTGEIGIGQTGAIILSDEN